MKVRGRIALCGGFRHIRRTVPSRHLKAVIRHVEREIAPHDAHADDADIHRAITHLDLPPSMSRLICRDLREFLLQIVIETPADIHELRIGLCIVRIRRVDLLRVHEIRCVRNSRHFTC